MRKNCWLLLFAFLLLSSARAQTVLISGKVTDKETEEAIPFANVYIKGTVIGVQTDFDGKYKMEIKLPADSLLASSIGYNKGARKINAAPKEQTVNFILDRSDYSLQEVVIVPGENPAIRIIKEVIARKHSHNKNKLNSYGYEAYNKIEIDLDDLSDKFKGRKIFKPFKFVFNNIDSVSEAKPFLPFFLSETVSDFHYRKTPLDRREIIKASKVSGINDVSISQFLGNMYIESDIYADWIELMQRQFISPISQVGMVSYRYYLVDSQFIDNFWCYKIQFFPKSKGGLTFEGDMWVADSVYAVKEISMKMTKDADVNFVRNMSMYNQFVPVKDSVWMLKKEKLIINFIKPQQKSPGIIGRKTASYKNFEVNEPAHTLDSLFKKEKTDVTLSDSAGLRDAAYWNKIRHDTLSFNEQKVYGMIDTLRNLPVVKTYLDVIQTLYLGYKDWGPVSIGNIFSFVSFNSYEGWRLKYGMSTSNKFSKNVMLGAYAAYGFRDKKIKYGGEFLWLIKKSPRLSIAASYRNDISAVSNYNVFYANGGLLANFGVRRVEEGKYIQLKLVGVQEFKAELYKEWKLGYSFRAGFVNRTLTPLGIFNFSYHTTASDFRKNTDITSATISEFTFTQRFAWQEKFVSGEFNRLSLGSKYPILFLQYGLGRKRILNGDFNYHRLVAGIADNEPLGPLGRVYFIVEAGKTFGTLPFLFLHMPEVSESYIYTYNGMNTIRDYQFAADRYVKVILEHHLGGILFNRIPGFRKLKWREVWSARLWWGDMTAANRAANFANMADNPYNTGLVKVQVPDKVPLVEFSAGIENILKIVRVDVFWRATHLDKRGSPFSFRYGNFGVRVGLQLQF
jgi:hypothetical protein